MQKCGHNSGLFSPFQCFSAFYTICQCPIAWGCYNPSVVPGNVCNMFLWDCVLCGLSYVCNFGLTWGTIHKSGLFRFTIRSCQTARSFILPSSHYRVGTAPPVPGLASAAGQESPRSGFMLVGWVVVVVVEGGGGGYQVARGSSAISGKRKKKRLVVLTNTTGVG